MKKYNLIILLFLLSIFAVKTYSQDVKAIAKIDSSKNKIIVGDQIKLIMSLTYPLKTTISWPDLKDSLSKNIEIIEKSKIDTINKDAKSLTLSQTYTLTSFDSGSFYIPQIHFKYKNAKDTAFFEALTDSLLLNVNTVAVDTTKAIKDIKGPLNVPLTFMEILPYLIGLILLAAIVWLVIYYLRKRKKGESILNFSKPQIPAHEQALIALGTLKSKKLWQNNKLKDYYTELTEIVRIYIEKRYKISALEMTSDEIITSFKSVEISNVSSKRLVQIFILADLVKFAKATPLPNEHDISMENAIEFVNETKIIEILTPVSELQKTDENIIQNNKPENVNHAN